MPYVTSGDMLRRAYTGGYAVPAFNAEDLEMIQGIIAAAEEKRSPVMLQTTPSTLAHMGPRECAAIVRSLAAEAAVPVALHLDHCPSFEGVAKALQAGYSSVMIDASALPFEENITTTRSVVRMAHACGVTVEAELGLVGGKEDSLVVAEGAYTDPEQATLFIRETGVDIFAPAIGTAHGFYKGEPKLDFDRLALIRSTVDIPLVLHGGSGIPDTQVQRMISMGMAKVNYATELRAAATKAVRQALEDTSIIDPKKFMGPARDAVYTLCLQKIDVCGSAGKA